MGNMEKLIVSALGLLSQEHVLIVSGEGHHELSLSERGPYPVVQVMARGQHKARGAVEGCVLEEMVKQGLVEKVRAGYRINGAGRSCYQRTVSGADPYQLQHQDRGVVNVHRNGRTRSVVVNNSESPLAWLRKRRGKGGRSLINDEQFNAGERLREDFWFAQMAPRVTANWSAPSGGKAQRRGPLSGSDMSDNVIAAKERVRSALDGVGPEFASVLVDVCCHMHGLKALEKTNGWPQRSGKIVLVLALNSLARHYGMTGSASTRKSGFECWSATDARPNLDEWR